MKGLKNEAKKEYDSDSCLSDISLEYIDIYKNNNLDVLCRKFLKLISSNKKVSIDLNIAASILNVKKSKIYDLTKTLEELDLI